ncbi:MAG: sensor domain-containing diguanylate cyclase [Methylococcaceae bacterium]|nr:sensor domain-containing diguanylate cyclase [Methylococcaceae bacterium]
MDEISETINRSKIPDIIVDLLGSLSAIKELSELNSQSGNEKELIFKALSVLIQNQDMERCSFFILDKENYLVNLTGLSIKEHLGGDKAAQSSLKFKIGEGIIGLAAKTGTLQHCNDCNQDPRFSNHISQTNALLPGSIISVPVMAANELLGVLNISHPEANYFSEWHIRLLLIYKNMMGELITNYRLLQQMEEQIAVRTKKLEAALEDINQLKEHFESMSMLDELTGLYNRRYFYVQIESILARTKRHGQSVCILVFDLDHFKKINDAYGHGLGDIVLKDVSNSVREEIRESDILVRFGGEEFVIIFTDTDSDMGQAFAERIRTKIASLSWQAKGDEIHITASIGVHCVIADTLSQDDIDIDSLIGFADHALYTAKASGRNKTVLFKETDLNK